MNEYLLAWLVVLGTTIVGAAALFRLLKNWSRPLLRHFIVALVPTLLLVPAPVPGYEGVLAPAFIIAIFEFFFQIEGQPELSARILMLSVLVTSLLVLLVHYLMVRRSLRVGQVGAQAANDDGG